MRQELDGSKGRFFHETLVRAHKHEVSEYGTCAVTTMEGALKVRGSELDQELNGTVDKRMEHRKVLAHLGTKCIAPWRQTFLVANIRNGLTRFLCGPFGDSGGGCLGSGSARTQGRDRGVGLGRRSRLCACAWHRVPEVVGNGFSPRRGGGYRGRTLGQP